MFGSRSARRIAGVAGVLLLVGCGGTPAATPTTAPAQPTAVAAATTAATTAAQPTTAPQPTAASAATTAATTAAQDSAITFQIFGSPDEIAVYQELVKAYMAANPGRTVNLAAVPSQDDDFTRLLAAFSAGTPPDVFLVNYRPFAQLATSGVLEPVAPYMKESGVAEDLYYSQALDPFRYNGQLTCLPQNISSLVVFYNKDLFLKNKVPLPTATWTWSEMREAAIKLTQDTDSDKKVDTFGLAVESELVRVAPFVWQIGSDIVDNPSKPTKLTLDAPLTREAIDFFIGLRARYGVTPPELAGEDATEMFRDGKLGMLLFSRRVVPALRKITGFTWDVAPLPLHDPAAKPATVLHSDAMCMPVAGKNKAGAWDFIRYADGPEGQKLLAELGRVVPSLKSVAQSPAFLAPDKAPASSQVFLDVIPSIRALPFSPHWSELESAVNEELERAIFANDEEAGGAEVEPAGELRSISPKAQALIDKALETAQEEGSAALAKDGQR